MTEAIQKRWLVEAEVARIIRFSLSTLRKYRHYQKGLPYAKIGRSVRYSEADVQTFMVAKKVEPRL